MKHSNINDKIHKMRVLVACEESQTVCKAFRQAGHEAFSCDLQECSGGHPEWHFHGDVMEVLFQQWDMIIAHPPCTYLANSGVRWLHKQPERWALLDEACAFFNFFLDHPCTRICVENPVPHKYAIERLKGRRYTQTVQPWQFGHPESKRTCLWLKGLPELVPTENVYEEYKALPKSQGQRMWIMPPGPERAKLRSKTYTGIAQAMAEQWGT